jgi:uncharacterized protein Veg
MKNNMDAKIIEDYTSEFVHVQFIDSFNRNKTMWPTPNSYSYELDDIFTEVVSIELAQITIPTFSLREIADLRYITVVCEEIEDRLHHQSIKLGRISLPKLTDNYVVAQRPHCRRFFKPIAKLSKLTFKLLLNDTTELIDFLENADHTMQIEITTRKLDLKIDHQSVLNPRYDALAFMLNPQATITGGHDDTYIDSNSESDSDSCHSCH